MNGYGFPYIVSMHACARVLRLRACLWIAVTHVAPPLHACYGVGKTAMLAGATDERIAITNPNNSGIGGASLNRLKGVGSEEVNSFWTDGEID